MAACQQCIAYFDHFDQDESGTICDDEFKHLHADLVRNGYTTKPVDECLADLDHTGDGQISFNEYCDWLERIGALKVKVMV